MTSAVIAAGNPTAIDVGGRKQLFIDDKFIAKAIRVKLTVNPPVPGGVAIDADKPWDAGYIDCASILKDETGKYRAYYACTAPGKDGKPGQSSYCLATSTDGIQWEKPNLGLVEFGGSKNNNILPGIPRGDKSLYLWGGKGTDWTENQPPAISNEVPIVMKADEKDPPSSDIYTPGVDIFIQKLFLLIILSTTLI